MNPFFIRNEFEFTGYCQEVKSTGEGRKCIMVEASYSIVQNETSKISVIMYAISR